MLSYRIYELDGQGRIASATDVVAENDVAAVSQARHLQRGNALEIWEGVRIVAALDHEGRHINPNYFGVFRPKQINGSGDRNGHA